MSIFPRVGHTTATLPNPPQLITMTTEGLRREIDSATETSVTTVLFEYGVSSFELIAGPFYKAYTEDGAPSWWVGDHLVATARDDASPTVPSPSLVFIRVGWSYPLRDLLIGRAA